MHFHNRNNQEQAELPYSGIFIRKNIRIISRGSNVYICLVFCFVFFCLFVFSLLTNFLFLCCEQILWEAMQGRLWWLT